MEQVCAAADHLVAALWANPSQYPIVASLLDAEDMPDNEAGIIYRIMAEQGSLHLPVRGLVETEAIRRGVTQDYLFRLNFRGRHEEASELEAYAETIANHANKSKLAALGVWLQAEAKNGTDSDEIKAEVLRRLTLSQPNKASLRPLSVFVDEAEKDFNNWMNGIIEGMSTGFPTLDQTLRLIGSEFTVIAGRPGSGKTSLTWQIVTNVAEELKASGDPGVVAVFSADMSGRALIKRAACSIAGVDSKLAKRNMISKEEQRRVQDAMAYLRTIPVWMDDSSSPSTNDMYYRMLALNAQKPVRMMMFDFIELGSDEGDSEELRISNIAKRLRGICKNMNIPVLADSQLGRDVEKRADKIPALSDLRYSGMLEQVADNVLLIMRPEYYIKRGQAVKLIESGDGEGIAYVIQAKGRNDGVGFYRMAFVEQLSKFAELERMELN